MVRGVVDGRGWVDAIAPPARAGVDAIEFPTGEHGWRKQYRARSLDAEAVTIMAVTPSCGRAVETEDSERHWRARGDRAGRGAA